MRLLLALILSVLCALEAAPAGAAAAPASWPPAKGEGSLFVHFGEEHVDDEDGSRIFPIVIRDSERYGPDVVVASADKGSDGTVELLTKWRGFMTAFDRAGIPYFAGVGNHDRKAPPGVPGGLSPIADLGNYEQVFSGRPYPFGDATPYADPKLRPRSRPSGDPSGASSHYSFDYSGARWLIIDNSCYSIINCDALQNPSFPNADGDQGQYDFIRREAAEATARGMKVFISMHMPTQDPRPGHTQPTPSAHTMGEGTSPDNQLFEQVVAEAGVDGVFAGHIKGQWVYSSRGVPYYTDGGAGGEVYVGDAEEVGVDYGYWHGYRLVRLLPNGRVVTDAVPVFVAGGIRSSGPSALGVGDAAQFSATGKQPTEHGPAVDALELRDPDPTRPNRANLPSPARIWTSANPLVLAPIAAKRDDSRRDRGSQTVSGRFRAVCPGSTSVTVTAGWESTKRSATVRSRSGPILSSFRRRTRRVRRGRSTRVAVVRLAQRAQVRAEVRRRTGRRIRTLVASCRPSGALSLKWDARNSRGRRVSPGLYTVVLRVSSDRKPIVRRLRVRVAGARRSQTTRPGEGTPRFTG